jgi:SAM-dependent methyltransferase
VPANEPGSAAVYDLARCERCGTAVTIGAAPPDDVHETGAYRPGAPRLAGVAAPLLRRFDRKRLALLARGVSPPARLLDAGAGRGRFVAAARVAGYEARGIEPSARGVDGAAASYGVALERATIESAAVVPRSLDAVTLWHVLEHLDDPGAALDAVAGWLRPGGALLVGVPNRASLQARLAGDRWFHLDLPRHRVHFTPKGLRTLLEAHGFEAVSTTHVLLEHNPFGMWQSLTSRATTTPSWLYHALKRNAPLDARDALVTAAALALLPLAVVLEAVAGLARQGGTIAVVARRTL